MARGAAGSGCRPRPCRLRSRLARGHGCTVSGLPSLSPPQHRTQTAWMPRSCRKNDMVAASTSYEGAAGPASRVTSGRARDVHEPAGSTYELVRQAGQRRYRRRASRRRAAGRWAGWQVGGCAGQPRGDGHMSRIARRAHPKAHVRCGTASAVSGWTVVGGHNRVGGVTWLECYRRWRSSVLPGAEHAGLHVPEARGLSRGLQRGHSRPAAHAAGGTAVVGEPEVAAGLARQSAGVGQADLQPGRDTGVDTGG